MVQHALLERHQTECLLVAVDKLLDRLDSFLVQPPHQQVPLEDTVVLGRGRHDGGNVDLLLLGELAELLEKSLSVAEAFEHVVESLGDAARAQDHASLGPRLVVLAEDLAVRKDRDVLLEHVQLRVVFFTLVVLPALALQELGDLDVEVRRLGLGLEIVGVKQYWRQGDAGQPGVQAFGTILAVFLCALLRQVLPHAAAIVHHQAHTAARLREDPRLATRVRGDHVLVLVVVHAAHGPGAEPLAQGARQRIVVDQQPARVLRVQRVRLEVGQGQEILALDAGVGEGGAELAAQREVLAGEVGEGDVQGVTGGVAAEVGKEDGGAERVEVCEEGRRDDVSFVTAADDSRAAREARGSWTMGPSPPWGRAAADLRIRFQPQRSTVLAVGRLGQLGCCGRAPERLVGSVAAAWWWSFLGDGNSGLQSVLRRHHVGRTDRGVVWFSRVPGLRHLPQLHLSYTTFGGR